MLLRLGKRQRDEEDEGEVPSEFILVPVAGVKRPRLLCKLKTKTESIYLDGGEIRELFKDATSELAPNSHVILNADLLGFDRENHRSSLDTVNEGEEEQEMEQEDRSKKRGRAQVIPAAELRQWIKAEKKAKLSAFDRDMDFAIWNCFQMGNFDHLINVLEDRRGGKKHDVNFQRTEGDLTTALMAACHVGKEDVITLLLNKYGANPNLEDVYGNTALNHLDMAPDVLSFEAKIRIRDLLVAKSASFPRDPKEKRTVYSYYSVGPVSSSDDHLPIIELEASSVSHQVPSSSFPLAFQGFESIFDVHDLEFMDESIFADQEGSETDDEEDSNAENYYTNDYPEEEWDEEEEEEEQEEDDEERTVNDDNEDNNFYEHDMEE